MALTKVSTDGVKDDAITAGKIPANAIGASELADNAVDSNAIADDAVTTNKIADNNVTFQQLGSNTVKTGNIEGGAITTDRLADQAVTLAKLPHGDGSNDGKFLRANNGADPSFETVTGTTINNNADNRVITGSGTANTLEGEADLTYDGSKLQLNDSSISQLVQSYSGNNRFKILAGSNFLQMISQNDVSLQFRYATDTGSGSEICRITSHGLSFDSNAAADSLDDYEEGTFTPAFKATGSSNNANTSVQESRYIKIGGLVFVSFFIDMNAHGNSTDGYANITGLPFTASGRHYPVTIGYYNSLLQSQTMFTGTVQPSSNLILLRHCTGACSSISGLDYSDAIGTSTEMIVSAVYSTV